MSGYGLFMPSTLGMQSQSHRLNTIGYNIANVNTGGFKRTDTEFETVLSDKIYQQSDIGGVKPYARATNDVQGLVTQSNRNLDVAIVGKGFFAVQPELNSTTEIYFTRDGSFGINTVDGETSTVTADDGNEITVNNGYLVDKNGYFVLGSALNEDGTFSSSAAAPMRVDQYAFINQGRATTEATMEFNLPAGTSFGDDSEAFTLKTYDSAFQERNLNFSFDKLLGENLWRMSFDADGLTTGTLGPQGGLSLTVDNSGAGQTLAFNTANRTIRLLDSSNNGVADTFSDLKPGDEITFAGTGGGNDGTYTISEVINNGSTIVVEEAVTTQSVAADATASASFPPALEFSELGVLETPTELTLSATWDDGETSTITIDISEMTQFAGSFTPYISNQNGYAEADIVDVSFNEKGEVLGSFSDGTQRAIYKLPLYDFPNPNGLYTDNGMIFKESPDSGSAVAFFADQSDKASLQANALEISNVDIAQEFSRMIVTQNAYNMSATTFKTIDEMTTVARDLKA